MFYILEFIEENSCDFVPANWMAGRKFCYWPPNKCDKRRRANEDPSDGWEKIPVRIIGSAESMEEARKKSIDGQFTSNVDEAHTPAKRPRQPSKALLDSLNTLSPSDTENRPSVSSKTICIVEINAFTPISELFTKTFSSPLVEDDSMQLNTPNPRTNAGNVIAQSCNCSSHLKSIFRELARLRESVTKIHLLLSNLEGSGISDETGASSPFPFHDEVTLDSFEIKDKSHERVLAKMLSLKGKPLLRPSVNSMLREALSKDLAMKFNLTGANGKKSFVKSPLFGIVKQSIRMNRSTANAMDSEIQEACRRFFKDLCISKKNSDECSSKAID